MTGPRRALTLRSKGQTSRSQDYEVCYRSGYACRYDCFGFQLFLGNGNCRCVASVDRKRARVSLPTPRDRHRPISVRVERGGGQHRHRVDVVPVAGARGRRTAHQRDAAGVHRGRGGGGDWRGGRRRVVVVEVLPRRGGDSRRRRSTRRDGVQRAASSAGHPRVRHEHRRAGVRHRQHGVVGSAAAGAGRSVHHSLSV